jgi:hypothetical protein
MTLADTEIRRLARRQRFGKPRPEHQRPGAATYFVFAFDAPAPVVDPAKS